ncbi:MAG TPA: ATP-binding protein [Anaeromyxobacteraceae bacterium]|nr:ATP-binding protein [Anaeromyxobacteraceae bacterium]
MSARPERRVNTNRIKLSWLIRLQFGGVVGQTLAIFTARWILKIDVPVGILLALVGLELIGTIALEVWLGRAKRVGDATIAGTMLVDAMFLTVLLALSGGYWNPFCTMYLVNVALATVLLEAPLAWAMLAATLLLFGSLFALSHIGAFRPLSGIDHKELMALHMQGLWISSVLAGAFIVYIVQRVQLALTRVQQALAEERSLSARKDKVASLATLAAGAAHELSTPLSTIAVVVKELQRSAERQGSPESSMQDLVLIREQVARCRDILHHMSAQAGENAGEPFVAMPLSAWVSGTLEHLPGRERVELWADFDLETHVVSGPPRGLTRALRGLLKNALQASPVGSPVLLRLVVEAAEVLAQVVDRGCGMPGDILSRAGEPFFTTKVPGEGIGLGLFLTQTLAEQLGGGLELSSAPGNGTTATLRLPIARKRRSEVK